MRVQILEVNGPVAVRVEDVKALEANVEGGNVVGTTESLGNQIEGGKLANELLAVNCTKENVAGIR